MTGNMEPDIDKLFRQFIGNILKWLFAALIIFIIIYTLTGCNVFRALKKEESEARADSVNVKKQTEVSSKVDTTKTKTETIHTKETIYQPQPIYIQGKDGETKVIFVPQSTKETGSNKEEKQNFSFEDYRKDFMDSVKIAEMEKQLAKQSETKGSLLGMGFWIGVSLVGLVLIGLMVMVLKMKTQFTSINNLLTKK